VSSVGVRKDYYGHRRDGTGLSDELLQQRTLASTEVGLCDYAMMMIVMMIIMTMMMMRRRRKKRRTVMIVLNDDHDDDDDDDEDDDWTCVYCDRSLALHHITSRTCSQCTISASSPTKNLTHIS